MKKVLNWLFGDELSKSDKIYYLGLSIIPIFGEDNKKFDIPYKLIRYGDERVNKDPESIEEYVNFQSHWNSIMMAIMIMVFINAGLKDEDTVWPFITASASKTSTSQVSGNSIEIICDS